MGDFNDGTSSFATSSEEYSTHLYTGCPKVSSDLWTAINPILANIFSFRFFYLKVDTLTIFLIHNTIWFHEYSIDHGSKQKKPIFKESSREGARAAKPWHAEDLLSAEDQEQPTFRANHFHARKSSAALRAGGERLARWVPARWIGRSGPTECPPRSPTTHPATFSSWATWRRLCIKKSLRRWKSWKWPSRRLSRSLSPRSSTAPSANSRTAWSKSPARAADTSKFEIFCPF